MLWDIYCTVTSGSSSMWFLGLHLSWFRWGKSALLLFNKAFPILKSEAACTACLSPVLGCLSLARPRHAPRAVLCATLCDTCPQQSSRPRYSVSHWPQTRDLNTASHLPRWFSHCGPWAMCFRVTSLSEMHLSGCHQRTTV